MAIAIVGAPEVVLALLAGLRPIGPFAVPDDASSLVIHVAAAALGALLLLGMLFSGSAVLMREPTYSPRGG